MKIKFFVGLIILTMTSISSATQRNDKDDLKQARETVVKQYVMDLQKADYKHITNLFENNGIVISTSQGKVDAKTFFYGFLPNISAAHTEFHDYFIGNDPDRAAVRFHLTFKLKDGEEGEGEYIDEFVFSKDSIKLSAVNMFENLKFKNE